MSWEVNYKFFSIKYPGYKFIEQETYISNNFEFGISDELLVGAKIYNSKNLSTVKADFLVNKIVINRHKQNYQALYCQKKTSG